MRKLLKPFSFVLTLVVVITVAISSVNAQTIIPASISSLSALPPGFPIEVTYSDGVKLPGIYRLVDTPRSNDAVEAYEITEEASLADRTAWDQHYDSIYLATKLRASTYLYNCHSYAWYSQSASNNYWINDPSPYYTDGSYYEVTSPQVGDIICYFDNMGTTSTSDDQNRHSGIVTEILSGVSNGECGNSDLVMVTSKWGQAGLYSHNGYECPYTNYYSGDADYVKYYRAAHDHSYTHHYAQFTTTVHYAYCSCGDYVTEAHNMVEMDDDPTKIICTECNHVVEMMKSIP